MQVVEKMERETGFEPATSSLGSWHSTTELLPRSCVVRHLAISQNFSTPSRYHNTAPTGTLAAALVAADPGSDILPSPWPTGAGLSQVDNQLNIGAHRYGFARGEGGRIAPVLDGIDRLRGEGCGAGGLGTRKT